MFIVKYVNYTDLPRIHKTNYGPFDTIAEALEFEDVELTEEQAECVGLAEVYSLETGRVVMSEFESAEGAWRYVFSHGGASKLQVRWMRK